MLTIALLGAPVIRLNGQELKIARRKSRAVIYYVAAQDRPVLRAQLLSMFWPDLPRPSALQTLRTTLHDLRKQLPAGLEASAEAVSLSGGSRVDVREFEKSLSDPLITDENLASALNLYRGEFLEAFSLPEAQAFEDWLTIQREHYRRLAIRGLIAYSGRFEAKGDFRSALEVLDRALTFDPLQEDLQRESMRLHYLAGDRPGAVRRYDELRRLLDEQMGVPPMAETRSLYDAIISDHPLSSPLKSKPLTAIRRRQPERQAGELPFAGRQLELQQITNMLAEGKLVVVEGEPGIGKSRLVEEFLRKSTGIVLAGKGRELEQNLPYQPMIEALRGLIVHPEWDRISARLKLQLSAVWLEEIGRLLPETGFGGQAPTTRQAAETRLWEAVHRLLVEIGQQYPLTLFIDDLHWADSASLGLLGYLVRQPDLGSADFLAAARSPAGKSDLSRFWQVLSRENRLARIALRRLSGEEVQDFVASIRASNPQQLADWLRRNSEGNPFILVELIRYLRSQRILDEAGDFHEERLSTGPVLPQTVYTLIESRLQGISEPARRVLDAAVAQGREFEFDVVVHAAGISENAGLDAIDELQNAGLIFPSGARKFVFDHSLTMEVAYREIGELRHSLLHRRVGEALESLVLQQEQRQRSTAAQLAIQFSEGNQPQKAAGYALQAAEYASHLAAWNEAIEFYQMAQKGLPANRLLPVLIGLSQAYEKAEDYAKASEALFQAREISTAIEDPAYSQDFLRLRLAHALIPQSRFAEVIELVREVLSGGSPGSLGEAELLWGVALSLEGADLDAAREHLLRAGRILEQLPEPDQPLLAQVNFELGSVMAQQGDIPGAVEYYRQALSVASRARGDQALEQRVLAYNNLAYHLHLLDDPAAADFAAQGLALAQAHGILGLQTYLYSTMGEIALQAGELAKAEELFQHGYSLAEQFSMPERIAGLTANLGLVAHKRGEASLAGHYLTSAMGQADRLGTHHLRAQIRLWLAPLLPPAEGRKRLEEARQIAESSGRKRLLEEIRCLEADMERNPPGSSTETGFFG